MALTEAQKRANAADIARRKALGDVKVTVWLSADGKARLDELTARHGTRQKALETALFAEVSRTATNPVKAVQQAPAANKPAYGSRLKQR